MRNSQFAANGGKCILIRGIFLLAIDGVMIPIASSVERGFQVSGFAPAFWGVTVLALLGVVIRAVKKNAG